MINDEWWLLCVAGHKKVGIVVQDLKYTYSSCSSVEVKVEIMIKIVQFNLVLHVLKFCCENSDGFRYTCAFIYLATEPVVDWKREGDTYDWQYIVFYL